MNKFKHCSSILSLVCLGLIVVNVNCQIPLGPSLELPYPGTVNLSTIAPAATIDQTLITVSGFSSGAFMSVQFHIAHSSIIKAAGVFAGGPYGQAYKNTSGSVGGGLNFLGYYLAPDLGNVSELVTQAQQFAADGHIDPLSNVQASNVFIFHGALDPLVRPQLGQRAKEFYDLLGASTTFDFWNNATHTVPTDNFGGPCGVFDVLNDAVNNCYYEELFNMFAKIYPDFIRPPSSTLPSAAPEDYHAFYQAPYVPPEYNSTRAWMSGFGFIYIPPACRSTSATCRLHVALHGCLQSAYDELAENHFALNAGYIQVALANNVIIVFPRSHPHYVDTTNTNYACWDFFGGTSREYLWKTGPQMMTVYNIMAYVARL